MSEILKLPPPFVVGQKSLIEMAGPQFRPRMGTASPSNTSMVAAQSQMPL